MNGDVFSYRVEQVTELEPEKITEMTCSEYDLTLFTCTVSGGKRVTVRCRLESFVPHDPMERDTEYVFY